MALTLEEAERTPQQRAAGTGTPGEGTGGGTDGGTGAGTGSAPGLAGGVAGAAAAALKGSSGGFMGRLGMGLLSKVSGIFKDAQGSGEESADPGKLGRRSGSGFSGQGSGRGGAGLAVASTAGDQANVMRRCVKRGGGGRGAARACGMREVRRGVKGVGVCVPSGHLC